MNFVKDLCSGKKDEYIHKQFIRYGKGEYERLFFTIKKGKILLIKSSYDFTNDFVRIIADNLNEKVEITGKIVGTSDFEKDWEFSAYTKRMGVYSGEFSGTFDQQKLKKLFEVFKNRHMLVNIKGANFRLSCGKSLPKPGGNVKDNFCSAALPLNLIDEFCFDCDKEFNVLKIKTKLIIDDVVVPKEYLNDFAKARQFGVRKGKLIREIDIDGKQVIKEYKLEA